MTDNDPSLLFPPTGLHKFKPSEKCLTYRKLPSHNVVSREMGEGSDIRAIRNRLEDAGFRRLSPDVRSGTFALVLEANDNQMIRISTTRHEADRPDSADVLQALTVIPTNNPHYRIEVLPRVHTLSEIISKPELVVAYGIKEPAQEAEAYIRRLMVDNFHQGKFFFDINPDNVALVKDKNGHNVPLIIDPGAVVDVEKAKPAHYDQISLHLMFHYPEIFTEFMDMWLKAMTQGGQGKASDAVHDYISFLKEQHYPEPIDYAKAQQAHLERLGLKQGEIKGVINKEEFREHFSRSATFSSMIKKDRMYRSEIGEVVKAALADMEKDSAPHNPREAEQAIEGQLPAEGAKQGFCQRIKAAYERRSSGAELE